MVTGAGISHATWANVCGAWPSAIFEDADLEAVKEFAHAILEKPIELMDGVEETVAELSERHDLTVFTKGDPEEQRLKIERSGLSRYFEHTAIVKEKNKAAYHQLAAERAFLPPSGRG